MAELTDVQTIQQELRRVEQSIFAGSTDLTFPNQRQMEAAGKALDAWGPYYEAVKELFLANLEAKHLQEQDNA